MNLWAGGWWREGRGSGCDLGSFSSPLGLEDAVEAEGTTGMSEQAGVDFGQRHSQCVSSWNLLAKKKREKLKNIYIIAGKKKKKKKPGVLAKMSLRAKPLIAQPVSLQHWWMEGEACGWRCCVWHGECQPLQVGKGKGQQGWGLGCLQTWDVARREPPRAQSGASLPSWS